MAPFTSWLVDSAAAEWARWCLQCIKLRASEFYSCGPSAADDQCLREDENVQLDSVWHERLLARVAIRRHAKAIVMVLSNFNRMDVPVKDKSLFDCPLQSTQLWKDSDWLGLAAVVMYVICRLKEHARPYAIRQRQIVP